MTRQDRTALYLRWIGNHPVISVLIAVATLLGFLQPLGGSLSFLYKTAFVPPAGLRVVDVRVVQDPWEAGQLVRPWFPALGDSMLMAQIGSVGLTGDPTQKHPMGGRWAGMQDTFHVVAFPVFGAFPELALLDIVVRNTAMQSAVVRRVKVRADSVGPSEQRILCSPMSMGAVYHIGFDPATSSQTVSVPIAYEVAGNGAERLGLLVLRKGDGGAFYRLRITLVYNENSELRLPPVEVELWKGCGGVSDQIRQPLQLGPAD